MKFLKKWYKDSFLRIFALCFPFLLSIQCQPKPIPDGSFRKIIPITLDERYNIFQRSLDSPEKLSMQEKVILADSVLYFLAKEEDLSDEQYFDLGQSLKKIFVGVGYIMVENADKNVQTFSIEDYVHRLALLKKMEIKRKRFSVCTYKEIAKDKNGRWLSYSHTYQAEEFDSLGIPKGRKNVIQVPVVPIDTLGTDFNRILMLQMEEKVQ